MDKREKSPNKGSTYYYKDGEKTTFEVPKNDWVKVHEPNGGFYFWCPETQKTTRTFPNKGTCRITPSAGVQTVLAPLEMEDNSKLGKRPTSKPPLPPPEACVKSDPYNCKAIKHCRRETRQEVKARKPGVNPKKLKKHIRCKYDKPSVGGKSRKHRRRKHTKKYKSQNKRKTKVKRKRRHRVTRRK